jgi:DDE superfamily endonuclease
VRAIAHHLGTMKRGFSSGELEDGCVESMDDTHLRINVDNGRTVAEIGNRQVKYLDVLSGGQGMTMMVRLSGGAGGMIANPCIVFQNESRSYPIRQVPDNVPGVSHRSQQKGWVDQKVMLEYISDPRTLPKLRDDKRRTLYVDNCSGSKLTPSHREALAKTNSELRFLPPNFTDLIQPADSFVVQKIKDALRSLRDKYLSETVKKGDWKNESGKISNPGKRYFLQLATDAIRTVKIARDTNGVHYARKAMIRCGMGLDLCGEWRFEQLSEDLREILAKHPKEFARGEEGLGLTYNEESGPGSDSDRIDDTDSDAIDED